MNDYGGSSIGDFGKVTFEKMKITTGWTKEQMKQMAEATKKKREETLLLIKQCEQGICLGIFTVFNRGMYSKSAKTFPSVIAKSGCCKGQTVYINQKIRYNGYAYGYELDGHTYKKLTIGGKGRIKERLTKWITKEPVRINPYAPAPLSDTATVIAKDGEWKGHKVVPHKKLVLGKKSGTTTTYYDGNGYFQREYISYYKPSIVPTPTPEEIEKEKELIEAGVRIDPKWIKIGVAIGIVGLLLAILSRRR